MLYEDDCCADNYIRVYLARTGNCDIGISHECETMGLKQYGTERVRNGFIAWCNCKDNREQSKC